MSDGPAAITDLVPPGIVAPELEAGTRLGGRYRLIARLGRGGGGAVWRAFDDKVGEEVALKLIDGGPRRANASGVHAIGREAADVERWRREVALARRISHGNVCRVYDLGEDGERRWVTMELVEGESLRARLVRGAIGAPGPLMHQLVDAVAAIHAAGVVHRDLKPENVVVDGSGRAVVVDFGLAREPQRPDRLAEGSDLDLGPATPRVRGGGGAASPDVTAHGTVLGTPRYMAPEQAAGEVADARSDVYALGLVLHEIATGGASGHDATATTVAGGPVDAGARRRTLASVPPPWGPLIARCTAHAPAERFADVVALRAALHAAQAAPGGRRRLALVGGALAVVLGLAGFAILQARGGGDRATARARSAEITQTRLTSTAATPAQAPTSVAISHDGATLAYTAGLALRVRSLDGGPARANASGVDALGREAETAVPLPTTPGGVPMQRNVFATGFLRDGRVLVQIVDLDHDWGLWAVAPGSDPQPLYQTDERMIAAPSPRGAWIAVATPGGGLVVIPLDRGPGVPLIAPRAGERLGGLAWSPDGTRLAFVRHRADTASATLEVVAIADPSSPRVIARDRIADPVDHMTAWAGERVLYAVNDPAGGAELRAVPSGRAGAAPGATLMHWPGEHIAQLAWARDRLVLLRGTTERRILAGVVDPRGYLLKLERALAEGTDFGRPASWSIDGALLSHPGADSAVEDEDLIYHRAAPGGGTEIRRVSPFGSDDRAVLVVPGEPIDGDLVRCAGDRGSPCVLAELEEATVRFVRFDPATGVRGDEVYRTALTGRFPRAMAVSPDATRLAVVDGSHRLAIVDLTDRHVEHVALDRSAEPTHVSWSHHGASLLVSIRAGGEDAAGVLRCWPGRECQQLLHSDQRHFGRVVEHPLGIKAAVEVRQFALDAWLIDGL